MAEDHPVEIDAKTAGRRSLGRRRRRRIGVSCVELMCTPPMRHEIGDRPAYPAQRFIPPLSENYAAHERGVRGRLCGFRADWVRERGEVSLGNRDQPIPEGG